MIAHLSKGFGHLPNVAEVRSLTQPLGVPMEMPKPAPEPKGIFAGFLKSVQKDINRAIEAGQKARITMWRRPTAMADPSPAWT